MSDSSSSESEDNSRYREACDPSFMVPRGGEPPAGGTSGLLQEDGPHLSHGGETRASFLLAGKIQQLLSRRGHYPIGLKVNDRSSPPGMEVHHRKASIPCTLMPPSSLSSYLAKRLTALLDTNLKFAITHDEGCDVPAKESKDGCGNRQSIQLLKNLVIGISTVKDDVPKKRKKVKNKMCYFDSSDEEEIASRCSSLAVSPEWILNKQDVYPWLHPKNIRYLENYKVMKKRDHGAILATSCEKPTTMFKTSPNCAGQKINGELNCALKTEEVAEVECKCVNKANSCSHCVTMPEKYESKKKVKRKHDSRSKTGDATCEIPHKTQKLCLERPNSVKKLRKQSRKRGKKKKIEPGDSSVTTD
ncbi:uncharacterized protein [Procambarus clarkii]|uniref:uncharacterized protein n=1 Tax=Procambarus clarkii TaxID=6728 RepID=UPI0037434BEF